MPRWTMVPRFVQLPVLSFCHKINKVSQTTLKPFKGMVIAVPLISEVGNSMNHCDDKSEGPTSVSPISSSSPSARPHKIVVVEDDHEMQRLLKEELQEAGYQVTQARNGTEAFAQVEAVKPDVIVSDLEFLGGGFEFIRALRQKYENGRIIIMGLLNKAV